MHPDLFSKAASPNSTLTMDTPMHTVFGDKPEASEGSIRVLHGHFCRALTEALTCAESDDQSHRRELGRQAAPIKPEATQAKLSRIYLLPWPHSLHFFRMTSADYLQACIAATFEYDARAYADKVRNSFADEPR